MCCVSAKDVESGGADGKFTKRVDGAGAAQPAGARRSCKLSPEVGGREYDIVDRIGEHRSLLNVVLSAINPAHLVIVNISQICLGLTGLSATVIMTLSKQLELDANAIHHNECASKYNELHRLIRAEVMLIHCQDSSYASSTDFLRIYAAELNRIEESAPAVPDHVSKRVGAKCT
jgi:hypothetical protein